MKVMVWNVRGLGSGLAFRTLLNLKQNHNPEVLILLETKVTHVVMESFRVNLGFSGKLVMNYVGHSGGICMLWMGNISVDLLSYTQSHIDVQVVSHGLKTWRLTGFYGHPEATQRHHSWALLWCLSEVVDLPRLCVGDFNEILCNSEKEGGLERSHLLLDNFRKALNYCGLEDLGFLGPQFTWSNRRNDNQLIQEWLDRGVSTFNWNQMFPFSSVKHLDLWPSDHRSLLIEVANTRRNQGNESVRR
ncbi:hypothetical protein Dsin_012282 [Dipteronia sinensis]|uniref:Endonuclease/exonuclease/phosphatase domain-containing protein n=1 Tax=Dipteronia sinensis TaxID=43782 RepID=A0AAE0AHS9_9ROSI|nr:hypothetical protein Dsin_012282 [Dipteronia sinensis]